LRPRYFRPPSSVQSLHVNARDFLEFEVPSAGEDRYPSNLAITRSTERYPSLAGEGSRRTCSSMFENLD